MAFADAQFASMMFANDALLEAFRSREGLALAFSSAAMTAGYARLRRLFETFFAVAFAAAGVRVLTARLS